MDNIAASSPGDRRDLFEETASGRGLSPTIIEKDFWVCWTLKQCAGLNTLGPSLIFKGGTSLSKAFGLIQRFSEDVDLSIRRSFLGFDGDRDPEGAVSITKRRQAVLALRESCRECVQAELLPALFAQFQERLGAVGWALEIDPADSNTINFAYPTSGSAADPASPGGYIRPIVRLEFGAGSDPYPIATYPITPYCAEDFPHVFAQPAAGITVLEAERTFWEKATLIHAEYHRPADHATPARISRHYYDLHQLAQSACGGRAITDHALLRRVVEHKQAYFASGWAHYESAANGALRLAPHPARRKDLVSDYARMRDMFFGAFPSFGEIIDTLEQVEAQVNSR